MTEMKITQPRTLPGFMELLPDEQVSFNAMADIIRHTYESFGFLPLDTPVMELSEVLLAKAGGETEKQIYSFQKGDHNISLRFDLTVPLAKYVALYHHALKFPFRRYQIAKSYRGERPQRGRFREFYQADVDIIGNGTLNPLYDAEIVNVLYSALKNLHLPPFTVHLNNRKILVGFFAALGFADKVTDIMRIVDKIAKIGADAVIDMLVEIGVDREKANRIVSFISFKGNNDAVLALLSQQNISDELYLTGVREMDALMQALRSLGVPDENVQIDLSIARGLDYYTGTVMETTLNDYPEIGSIGGGGRYDDLAGFYTKQKLPGVGASIGLTRLYDQLKNKGLIHEKVLNRVLVVSMDKEMTWPLSVAGQLRAAGIPTEVYFEETKFKNKMAYASDLKIPFVIIIGEDERTKRVVALKNMNTREQIVVPVEQAIETLKFAFEPTGAAL